MIDEAPICGVCNEYWECICTPYSEDRDPDWFRYGVTQDMSDADRLREV